MRKILPTYFWGDPLIECRDYTRFVDQMFGSEFTKGFVFITVELLSRETQGEKHRP